MQNKFFQKVKYRMPPHISMIDEISEALNIEYDAAYRRVKGKTNLSFKEALILAKRFKISLDALYQSKHHDKITIERTKEIVSTRDLAEHFRNSKQGIEPLLHLEKVSLWYSAKDIPFFYTLKGNTLSKFKYFTWMRILDKSKSHIECKTRFDDFQFSEDLIQSGVELGRLYSRFKRMEFWNDNTINPTLNQIFYFYETGLLSQDAAIVICEDLRNVILEIEKQIIESSVSSADNKNRYQLFYNEITTMSNNILIESEEGIVYFVPYAILSYFKIANKETCRVIKEFFEKQKINSKLLSNAGERDRSKFFNNMLRKIDTLKKRITLEDKASFL